MIEAQLVTLLKGAAGANVFPDTAPVATQPPYVIWQGIGGASQRYLDGQAASLRQIRVQITVWHGTRLAALQLARTIEDALCTSATLIARPEGEPIADAEPDLQRYASMQDYVIWGARDP